MSFRPIIEPTRPAGLYLRDTWQPRLEHLVIALLALCCAAALLGLAIIGVLLATAAIEHDYVTWGLFVDLLLAAATGAGAVVAGRAFIQSGWSAIRPLPAVYPEPATGAAVPTTQLPSWANR